MHQRIVSAFLSILVAVSGTQSASALGLPKPFASMKLMRDIRGPVKVRTRSTEGVPLRVLFDTAAANSILFDHAGTMGVGRRLEKDYYVYFPFTDKLIDFRLLDWFTLRFGDHEFTSNNWVYGPWKSTGLFPGREAPNYDIIAGRDVFANFAIAVNPDKQRVSLFPSGTNFSGTYDTMVDLIDLNPLIAVRTKVRRAESLEIEEKLMIIDTGFHGVLLFANQAELEELQADETTAPADTLGNALIAKSQFSIGAMHAVDHAALIVSKGTFEADGVIGTAFLNDFSYAFDVAERKLYLSALKR